jgi:Na+-translocating ferredoxin:NAD+ oxidoreductase RnfD subunit
MRKLNIKEIYVACLILLIGAIYLAAQANAFLSMGSTRVNGDVIQFSKNEMLSHLRGVLTTLLCFSGGILLLKRKKAGWIISLSILLLLLTIASGIFFSNITALNISAILLTGGILLLLLAVIFLLQKQTRDRFMIVRKSFVSAIIFFGMLSSFYFLL